MLPLKKEFLNRYNEIFDDSLKQAIINSDIHKDWSNVGWRGFMLHNGLVWIDTDGDLKSINYQSGFEKKEWERLIERQRSKLYPGLRKYQEPVLFMATKKFRIRIDDLGNGDYRYASWPINKSQAEKPDLVLANGRFEPDGNGGNHEYIFKKGDYTYSCYIWIITPDGSPPAVLTISKGKKKILKEPALQMKGD